METQTATTPVHEPARNYSFEHLGGKLPGAQLEVEIDCISDTQVIPGACVLRRGKNRVTIFAADLPLVQAMVRSAADNAAYDAAVESHKRRLDNAIAKAIDGVEGVEEIERMRKRTIDAYVGSPEAYYAAEYGRDPGPLRSVKVLSAQPLPPPVDPIADARDKSQATVLASALATAMSSSIAAEVAKALRDARK